MWAGCRWCGKGAGARRRCDGGALACSCFHELSLALLTLLTLLLRAFALDRLRSSKVSKHSQRTNMRKAQSCLVASSPACKRPPCQARRALPDAQASAAQQRDAGAGGAGAMRGAADALDSAGVLDTTEGGAGAAARLDAVAAGRDTARDPEPGAVGRAQPAVLGAAGGGCVWLRL